MKKLLTQGQLSVLIVFAVLIIDQIIKILVKTNMYWHESIRITDWFYIYFTENNGMAFGMEIFGKLFLTTFRITKARELLDSTNYPIESIALSCGYSDALVFTKAFHAMKGMSPSKYRKESHKESTKEQLQEVEGLIARLLKP